MSNVACSSCVMRCAIGMESFTSFSCCVLLSCDAYDSGTMGFSSRTNFQIGIPSDATGLSTAGGITVIGAALDNFIRAYNTETDELLWEQRRPAGNQAAPLIYIPGGRQYIVAGVGGHDLILTKLGDYVMAWSLPVENN